MRRGIWYVWSSGIEEWEPMVPGVIPEVGGFKSSGFQHSKTFGKGKINIWLDSLGRYLATYND